MKILGKFWLKNGAIIESTVDAFEGLTKDEVEKEINNIKMAVSMSFQSPTLHLKLEFGGMLLRGDDISAVYLEVLDEV